MATQITSDITEQLDYNDDCVAQINPESTANEEGELTDDRDVETTEKAETQQAVELEDGELSDDGDDVAANQHPSWAPPGWRPGYCKFFLSNRGCRYGAQCRYIHPDLAELRNSTAAATATTAATDRNEPAPATKVTAEADIKASVPQTGNEAENAEPKNGESVAASTENPAAKPDSDDKTEIKAAEPTEIVTNSTAPEVAKTTEPANRPRIVFAPTTTGPTQRDADWLKAVARARELHRRAKQRKLDADPESLREKNLNASLVDSSAKQPPVQTEADLHVEYADADDLYSDALRSRQGGVSLLQTLNDVPSVDEATRELNELRRRKQSESSWKHFEAERRERERERDRDRQRDRDRDRNRDHDRSRQPRGRDRSDDRDRDRDRSRTAIRSRDVDTRKRRRGGKDGSATGSESDSDTKSPAGAAGAKAKKATAPGDAGSKRKHAKSDSSSSDSSTDSDSDLSTMSESSTEANRGGRQPAKRGAIDTSKRRKVEDTPADRNRYAKKPNEPASPLKRANDDVKKRQNTESAFKRTADIGTNKQNKDRDRERADRQESTGAARDKQFGSNQRRAASDSDSDGDSDAASRRRKRLSKFESEQSSANKQQSSSSAQKRGNASEKTRSGAGNPSSSEKYDVKPSVSNSKDEDRRGSGAAAPVDKDVAKNLKRNELMKKLVDVQAALDRTQARIHKSRDGK